MYYVSMYYANRCQELYLSQEGTWTTTATITQEQSGLAYDIIMPIRALEGKCFLTAPAGMAWGGQPDAREVEIHNNQTHKLVGASLTVNMVVFEMQKEAMLMPKYQLPMRQTVRIGRGSENAISQDSSIMTQQHGELTAFSQQECFYTDHSRNGTYINGVKVSGQRVQLAYGDVILLGFGLKIVYLGNMLAVNKPPMFRHVTLPPAPPLADIQFDYKKIQQMKKSGAVIWYHRAPRILDEQNTEEVSIEPPLNRDNNNMPPIWMTVGPSATMVVPMLLSAMVGGRTNIAPMMAMMGGSAAMAVMWGMININYRRRHGAETEAKRKKVYSDYIIDTENKLLSLTEQEQARLNSQCLTVRQCLALPVSNTHRLWERMPQHADFLTLRLGVGRVRLPNPISIQPSKLQVDPDPLSGEAARLKETYEYMNDAPISVQLRNWQIIGILGALERPCLMQSLVAQLAATHSYHDVVISVLAKPTNRSQWDWTRWLPHIYSNEERSMRLAAFTPDAVRDVLEALSNVLMMRDEQLPEEKNDAPQPLPHYVVFCTDSTILENQPFMKRMLRRPLGFTLVMMAESMEQLPKECGLIIQAGGQIGAVYTAQGDITNVRYEIADLPALRRFSQQMAPLRVKDAAESSYIPSLITFLEIYHVRSVDDLDVWRYWSENHAYDGLRSTIGLRAGAQPFVLDISERFHGPHGLVAGTTGSGKSVMLQTYILSLAVNYHPEEVQFILIDYKGGGMANAFKKLPHVAGIIDNLQGKRVISRALLSIQGEIKRREAIFSRLQVEKIDEYIRYYNHDPNERPLAHLIIVVDEFAELKKEQPEFMAELISTARVGRSVGIHMILATQKPSNSVDDEIWSNTNFRICLRVATRADSNDMLKRPDAAYLKGMGRCYVQVGNDEIFEQVQTSFSGAEYAPLALNSDEEPHMLDDAGRPIKIKKKKKAAGGKKPPTQMDAVLDRIGQIMEEHRVRPTDPLWLLELESTILLDSIPGLAARAFDGSRWQPAPEDGSVNICYGMVDDVHMQRHLPLYVNLSREHNVKIVAPAAMGKTTLIQTMVLSAALTYSPADVQMYIFSLSSQTLGILAGLPHVGEVIYPDETVEAVQLLNLLSEENKRRAALFSTQHTDSFTQYNITAGQSGGAIERLPAIIVFVDRLKHLLERLGEGRMPQLYELIRNAASRGIYFVVTALSLTSEEMGRVSDSFTGIAIQQEDRSAYREVLGSAAAVTKEEAEVQVYPGRGLVWFDNGVHGPAACEMQCAVFGSPVDTERVAAIKKCAESMARAWHGRLPRRIARIPENLTYEGFGELMRQMEVEPRPGLLYMGLDKETGSVCAINLESAPSFLICGPLRSGRTNAVLVIAESMRRDGVDVHLFGESPSLRRYAEKAGQGVRWHDVSDSGSVDRAEELAQFFFTEFSAELKARKEALAAAGDNLEERGRISASFRPIALLFDDYNVFSQTMLISHSDILNWLPKVVPLLAERRVYMILTLSQRAANRSSTNELVQIIAKSGAGIALNGELVEADPWGVGTMANRRIKYPVGEAHLFQNGVFYHVVLPKFE